MLNDGPRGPYWTAKSLMCSDNCLFLRAFICLNPAAMQSLLWSALLSGLITWHALWSWLFCTTPRLYKKPNIKHAQSKCTNNAWAQEDLAISCVSTLSSPTLCLAIFPISQGVPQYDRKILPYRIQRQWKFIAALLSARCTKPSHAMGQPRVSCFRTARQASAWCLSVREILCLTPHQSSTKICQLHTYLVPLSVIQHFLSPQKLRLDKVVFDAMTNVIVLWFVKKTTPSDAVCCVQSNSKRTCLEPKSLWSHLETHGLIR